MCALKVFRGTGARTGVPEKCFGGQGQGKVCPKIITFSETGSFIPKKIGNMLA